jgi:hypothetical protein
VKNHDVIKAAVGELERLGIKSRLEDTGGGHVRLVWRSTPDKPEREYFMASTPSDWRAKHNARAFVRKMLRADNVDLDPKKTAPKPLENKVRHQQQPTEPSMLVRQIECLRAEIVDLSEWIFELALRMGKEREVATEPEATVTEQPFAKGQRISTKLVRAVNIVDFVTYTPLSTEDIARNCKLPKSNTYTKLMYARQQKKVFLRDGMWGRVKERA